jgi:hypothetical protein
MNAPVVRFRQLPVSNRKLFLFLANSFSNVVAGGLDNDKSPINGCKRSKAVLPVVFVP